MSTKITPNKKSPLRLLDGIDPIVSSEPLVDGSAAPETKIAATNRLNREKRLNAFRERCEELRQEQRKQGKTKGAANDEAWRLALIEFPPISTARLDSDKQLCGTVVELEKYHPGLLYEASRTIASWQRNFGLRLPDDLSADRLTILVAEMMTVHQGAVAETAEDDSSDEPMIEPGIDLSHVPPMANQADLHAAYLWVLNHPATVRDWNLPASQRRIIAEDAEDCPNRAAWNLLISAIKDPNAFRKESMSMLAKGKLAASKNEPEDEVEDDLSGWEDMLRGFALEHGFSTANPELN